MKQKFDPVLFLMVVVVIVVVSFLLGSMLHKITSNNDINSSVCELKRGAFVYHVDPILNECYVKSGEYKSKWKDVPGIVCAKLIKVCDKMNQERK